MTSFPPKKKARPTHMVVLGLSRSLFNRQIQREISKDPRFANVVLRFDPKETIIFKETVEEQEDVKHLIDYLVQSGISRSDIRIRYQADTGHWKLDMALSRGLRESGLSFGADVAERDEHLSRYFITTASFQSIKNHEKHIVVGPKGSGKSAILRELSSNIERTLVVTPEDYATEVLDTIKKMPGDAELAAYTTTWKYTLLIEVFRRIVQSQIGDARAIAEIRKYLVSQGHLEGDLTIFERFLRYFRRITRLKGGIGPAQAEVGMENAEELHKLFKMDELQQLFPELQKALRRNAFTVYIDELDQSWNNTDTANAFLVSLLTAAIQIRSISENLHVVAFLRSEIFDLLKPHLPQLDKLRSDTEVLHWSRRDLTSLIVTRAVESIGITAEDLSAEAAIRSLFPGFPGDLEVGSFEYLLSHTSLRPREVIQFCNLALAVAIRLGQRAVSPEAVEQAEEEFSSWKLEHIVAENMYIYPRLNELLERFRGKSRRLEASAMDAFLTDILLAWSEDPTRPGWIKAEWEPVDLLKLLYQIEVIGISKMTVHATETRIVTDVYDFSFTRPKGRPEDASSFLFHPGLWKALELI